MGIHNNKCDSLLIFPEYYNPFPSSNSHIWRRTIVIKHNIVYVIDKYSTYKLYNFLTPTHSTTPLHKQSTIMASFINPLNPIPPELRKIQGIDKLSRQIEKEVRSPNVNEKSSNLPHLLSILKCILQSQGQRLPSAVLKPFAFSKGRSGRLVVDLVSPDGDSWIKISARNPKALNLLAAGGGNFGQKSIVDHVQDYLICAKENPCLFRVPKVLENYGY